MVEVVVDVDVVIDMVGTPADRDTRPIVAVRLDGLVGQHATAEDTPAISCFGCGERVVDYQLEADDATWQAYLGERGHIEGALTGIVERLRLPEPSSWRIGPQAGWTLSADEPAGTSMSVTEAG